ncbi:hypothetical protein [Clostridium sp.]|uniref:hypothetical protein n=1 Tax=Clostridium sp. TaxID=1506 RepID=UPI002FCA0C59
MEKNKRKKVLIGIGVLLLITISLGIAYAFFKGIIGPGAKSNIGTLSRTTDSLTFDTGGDLSIVATQQNFTPTGASLNATTTGSAKLVANNNTNSASFTYNVGIYITNNSYIYTTGATATPELILTVTDPAGAAVTSIPGLTYISSGAVTGFDVTTKEGLIKVAENYAISATATSTTQNWTFKLTFVNLNSNQTENAGKSFNSVLRIQNETLPLTIASLCVGKNMASCIKDNYYVEGLENHTAALALSAEDNSYRYTGGDYSVATQHQNTYKRVSDIIIYDAVGDVYKLAYNNTLTFYYYDQALTKTIADGYVVKDESLVKNFVCFGSTVSPCPIENKYRIIGIFGNQVKLIKNTSVGDKPWDTKGRYGENTWSTSTLNTYLNGEYLTSLSTWSDKIATNTWQVGGVNGENFFIHEPGVIDKYGPIEFNSKNFHTYELGSKKTATTYASKVGLMYLSDYSYAVTPNNWEKLIRGLSSDEGYPTNSYVNTNVLDTNWIFTGLREWTISRDSFNSSYVWFLFEDGSVTFCNSTRDWSIVRPVFYLESNVSISNGEGTESSPYTLIV